VTLLTRAQIETAIPRVEEGLAKYLWLQPNLGLADVRSNAGFRRRFNHFYRIRREAAWQAPFYSLLEESKGRKVTYGAVLRRFFAETGRYEASFASKLVATVDPSKPVVDSIVLQNLGLKLPSPTCDDWLLLTERLHGKLSGILDRFLLTDDGRYLVQVFRGAYPDADITEIKMLDLALWQTRA